MKMGVFALRQFGFPTPVGLVHISYFMS